MLWRRGFVASQGIPGIDEGTTMVKAEAGD